MIFVARQKHCGHGLRLLVRAMAVLCLWVAVAAALGAFALAPLAHAAETSNTSETAKAGAAGETGAAATPGEAAEAGAAATPGEASEAGEAAEAGEASETVAGGVTFSGMQFAASGDEARMYKIWNGDYSNVHPKPLWNDEMHFPFVYLMFDKNVAFARANQDDSFIQANLSKVHLRTMDGREVDGSWADSLKTSEERRTIALYTSEWLAPLTTYQIVIDEGIMAANGRDVTDQRYVVEFTTGAECADGMTVYEKWAIVLLALALGAGMCVAIARRVWLRGAGARRAH